MSNTGTCTRKPKHYRWTQWKKHGDHKKITRPRAMDLESIPHLTSLITVHQECGHQAKDHGFIEYGELVCPSDIILQELHGCLRCNGKLKKEVATSFVDYIEYIVCVDCQLPSSFTKIETGNIFVVSEKKWKDNFLPNEPIQITPELFCYVCKECDAGPCAESQPFNSNEKFKRYCKKDRGFTKWVSFTSSKEEFKKKYR